MIATKDAGKKQNKAISKKAKTNNPGNKKNAKNVRNLKARGSVNTTIIEILNKIILAGILFIIFYVPYFRGLFFEMDFLKAEILVFIVFTALQARKLLIKEKFEISTPLEYASLSFAFVYLISIVASAGIGLAVEEWLKYCMYFAVFFIVTDIALEIKNRFKILWTIVFSAVGVCILGIDAFAGNNLVNAINNLFNRFYLLIGAQPPEKGTFFSMSFGGRLSSTFQYPNTLASYLIAVFIITVGISLLTESRVHRIISSIAGFLFLLAFVFTLSRGAYLLLPVMLVVLTIALPKRYRIKGVIYSLVPIIASIPSIIKISGIFNTNPSGNPEIWLWILPGAVIAALLSLAADRVTPIFEAVSWKVYMGILAGAILIGVIGLIAIFNLKEPLVIDFPQDIAANSVNIRRSIFVHPGREYTLEFSIAGGNQDKEIDYEINVYSNNEKEILMETPKMIGSFAGKANNDEIMESLSFNVPEDNEILYISFTNKTQGTSLVVNRSSIKDAEDNTVVKEVPLKYRYIPELIHSRLQDRLVTKSSIERMVFYKNGLNIFKDHWLIGAGGGAWSLLYYSYQSYLYISNQAHNYLVQTAIETGVPGILAIIFMVGCIIYILIKQRFISNVAVDNADTGNTVVLQAIIFTVATSLIGHAFIDFDFTYPSMLILLWTLLAVYNAGYHIPLKKPVRCNSGIIMAAALILIIRAIMVLNSGALSNKGMEAVNANDINSAIKHYETAAGLNPLKAEYKINYANLIISKSKKTAEEFERAGKWIKEAEFLAKNDVALIPFISKYYFSIGDISKALALLEKTLDLRPFRTEEWEQYLGACNSAFEYYIGQNDTAKAEEIINLAFSAISRATEVNKRNMNPFIFNSVTSQILEQFAYYKTAHSNNSFIEKESIVFYSLPDMDIDGNGIPDQWNTTTESEFILREENNMLQVEKTGTSANSFIQSRQLILKPNTDYKLEITMDSEVWPFNIRYFIQSVTSQTEQLEYANGIHQVTFSTPESVGECSLQLYPESDCVIKELKILEVMQ